MNLRKTKKHKIIAILITLCAVFYICWYFGIIRPHVDGEFNTFKKEIDDIKDTSVKVREIADFTEENYEQAYNRPLTLSIFLSRFLFGITNDPYFVAYYKAGAYAESASLFNFYANKSGFESRIVGTPAEDHQWVELKIDDRWVQADPTIYYYAYTDPSNYSNYNELWFDNQTAYSILGWYGGYSTVSVIGTNEDLTIKYCNTSKLIVYCENCDHIKIKSDNGRRFSIDQELKNTETIFTLGRKNYTIIADKNIIPFLLVKEDNVSISLLEKNNVNVTLNPHGIQWTIYSQMIFVVGVFAVLFAELYYLLRWGIEKIKKFLGEQE